MISSQTPEILQQQPHKDSVKNQKFHQISTYEAKLQGTAARRFLIKRRKVHKWHIIAKQNRSFFTWKTMKRLFKATKKPQKLDLDFKDACDSLHLILPCLLGRDSNNHRILQDISLHVPDYHPMTKVDVYKICQHLKRLAYLKKLHLNFSGCLRVGEKALNYLGKMVKKMQFLESLTLSFVNLVKITSKGMQSLGKALKRLKRLQNLNLNFEYCYSILDQGLHDLSKGLMKLNSLQTIYLNFREYFFLKKEIYRDELILFGKKFYAKK